MYWDGQPSIVLCDHCVKAGKTMLQRHSAFYSVRPIRVARHISQQDKEALKRLDKVEFRTAAQIGVSEHTLRGMVGNGLVTMTKGGSSLWYRIKS